MKTGTKKTALAGLLAALAITAFTIENLFPSVVPGARLGISNAFILFAAVYLGYGYAFTVLIVKAVVGSLLTGNVFAVTYSLPAGLVSLAIEVLLLKRGERFGLPAISATGAVINAALQNLTFCVITGQAEYFVYAPYLTLIGAAGGLIVGLAVYFSVKRLPPPGGSDYINNNREDKN
ncbi:MAG TPA: hypothetical protein DEV87_06835 [Clostridiales bacterium]|nr:hypothetical protein [Clostridiales bacterium]